MFRFLLRPIVLAVLVTLLIWLLVIVYWQETVRLVSAEDVGIYLVGLPLVVVGIGFGLRAGYRHYTKAKPSQEGQASARTAAPVTDERERGFALALLAVGLASGAGDAAAQTYETLKAREMQPAPDSELRNRDGFPVHACRVKDLDTEKIAGVLEAIDAAPTQPGVQRALALLERALAPVFDVVAAAVPEPDSRGRLPAVTAMPRLIVDLLLPVGWDERSRKLAVRYVGGLLAETGWPADASTLTAIAGDDGSVALRQLDAFCQKANRADSADMHVLASCESMIDEDVVSSLEASGRLFSTAQPQGQIPGEAAAAVLLRVPKRISMLQVPVALVGRVALSARGKSADSAGRIGHETLLETAQHGLAAAQLQAADICAVVSDVDHRASRCGECVGAMTALLPDLDPVGQFVGAGQSLGRLGAGGALFALGVAAAAVQAEEKPVLLVTTSHPTERAAVVLRTYVEPAKDAPVAA